MTYLSTCIHPHPCGCTCTHTAFGKQNSGKYCQGRCLVQMYQTIHAHMYTHIQAHIHTCAYKHIHTQTHTHRHTHTHHWNAHTHTHILLFVRSQFIPEVFEFDGTASPWVTAIKRLLKPVVRILHVQLVTRSFNAWQLCCCRQPSKTTRSVHLTDCIPLHVNLPRKITKEILRSTFVRTSCYVLPQ